MHKVHFQLKWVGQHGRVQCTGKDGLAGQPVQAVLRSFDTIKAEAVARHSNSAQSGCVQTISAHTRGFAWKNMLFFVLNVVL
jgi:hypothetical protein